MYLKISKIALSKQSCTPVENLSKTFSLIKFKAFFCFSSKVPIILKSLSPGIYSINSFLAASFKANSDSAEHEIIK